MHGKRRRPARLVSHSVGASKVVPGWQQMASQKLGRRAVGRRDPSNRACKSWEKKVPENASVAVIAASHLLPGEASADCEAGR